MSEHISVAIDGPSGAGKSSVARAAARSFGFLYVDTGAIYRTVGLAVCRRGIDSHDGERIAALLPALHIELRYGDDDIQHMYLDGEDVTSAIRTPEISMYASDVSAFPAVRAYLMDTQRSLARTNDVIMDGRDIGTVVLPDARVKIFLTASPEVRAKRRYDELIAKGADVDFKKVLEELIERDYNDSHREIAPLKPAQDSVTVNTDDLSLEQSINLVVSVIKEKLQ